MDPSIPVQFEKEFGCKVVVDYFEDPETMAAKMAAGGSSSYDVIAVTDTSLPGLAQRKLLANIQDSEIPNLKNVQSKFRNAEFDPGNHFGVPVDWGMCGLYYRRAPGKSIDATWGVFLDPSKQPGPIALLDDLRSCIGIALKYRGHSFNSTNQSELAEARDLLVQTKKRSLGFEGGTGTKNRVLNHSAVATMVYNGDAARGMKEDPETVFVVPREGSQIYVDVLSIAAQAPHAQLAKDFLNFMLRPDISAQFANYTLLATPNEQALPKIRETDRKNPAIYPNEEDLQRLEFAKDLKEWNRLYDDVWTDIKAH